MAGPDLEAALQQIAYVADELESLSGLVDRIPEMMLTTQPTPSTASVADVLVARHRRDEQLLESLAGGRLPEGDAWDFETEELNQPLESSVRPNDLPELLRSSARLRRDLVGKLAESLGAFQPSGEDTDAVAAKLYGLVHADADVFSVITSVLYAGPLTGRNKAEPNVRN